MLIHLIKMMSTWIILIFLHIVVINCEEDLDILLKTRSAGLSTYIEYVDVTIMRIIIPQDTLFSSFKFEGNESDLSIYGCTARKGSVYMQYGSPPVINPDGSKFPKSFKKITRPHIYHFDFKTDKTVEYINITSPQSGSYYIAAFLSYVDPRNKRIKQQGLSEKCVATVDCTVYVRKTNKTEEIVENKKFNVSAVGKEKVFYKMSVPELVDYAVITIDKIVFGVPFNNLLFQAQENCIPHGDGSFESVITQLDIQPKIITFPVDEITWHYLQFQFDSDTVNVTESSEMSSLEFSVSFVSSEMTGTNVSNADNNVTSLDSPIMKIHYSSNLTEVMPYQQLGLLRHGTTESFLFSYELQSEILLSRPVPINLTSNEYIALRFSLGDVTDIGGTLQYILAFNPREEEGSGKKNPEPENHIIVGCIARGRKEMPVWPDKCITSNGAMKEAPLLINSTSKNSSMLIPFPEYGIWHATFRLFCGEPELCDCGGNCSNDFNVCVNDCLNLCSSSSSVCTSCVGDCKQSQIAKDHCKGCDCDGMYRKSTESCKTGVLFDVSSMPCVQGECGVNGRCMLQASDGVLISCCTCYNNYRGWDCSDDSLANPRWLVVLSLLLLVLSNLLFLPAVYFAYRRKYYIEALCYFAVCFFSTFYHACDAGERQINFCMTRLASLQFADFFSALLAIWVTLIAIADLANGIATSLCHMAGAIILAFCTTINKTALWIFALPAIIGVLIILVSWYLKYRKVRQWFVRKRYLYINLPIGFALIATGLIIYTCLQRANTYAYLHSMWHIIMAVALVLVLPHENTFNPEPTL